MTALKTRVDVAILGMRVDAPVSRQAGAGLMEIADHTQIRRRLDLDLDRKPRDRRADGPHALGHVPCAAIRAA
jgi:hypothetical protein